MVGVEFGYNFKSIQPAQRDLFAAVRCIVVMCDVAGAACRADGRFMHVGIAHARLDNANDTVLLQAVVDHVQVALLKDVQWQVATWQQQGAAEREQRDLVGQLQFCHSSCI